MIRRLVLPVTLLAACACSSSSGAETAGPSSSSESSASSAGTATESEAESEAEAEAESEAGESAPETSASSESTGETSTETSGDGDGDGDGDGTTGSGDPGALLGNFNFTFYWVTVEDDFDGAATEVLYDDSCAVLATVKPDFADALRIEGTGRLTDDRILNYWGSCSCASSPCFFEADAQHPWGYGVQNRALKPLRSIAVDTAVLDIGQAVYVEALDGLSMPAVGSEPSFVHDGCLLADDIGGGINGQHLDFFAALRENYLSLVGPVGTPPLEVREAGTRCAWIAD